MLEIFWDNIFKTIEDDNEKIIKNCPLFSGMTKREFEYFKKVLHKRSYTPGEVIFKPLSGMGLYIIQKGKVNILHGNPESESTPSIVSSLEDGEFFGELSLVQNKMYQNIFAQAVNDTQTLALFRSDLEMILERSPVIASKILKQLCEILSRRLQKAEVKILQALSEK